MEGREPRERAMAAARWRSEPSQPRAMATSQRPPATASTASRNADEPVAEAFSTWTTGTPVRPKSFAIVTPSSIWPPM